MQIIESLSEDQALAVLRASGRPMMEFFVTLPSKYHRLALLVHAPEIERSKYLEIPMSDPSTTVTAIRTATLFPSLTALAFRPTLGQTVLLQVCFSSFLVSMTDFAYRRTASICR